MFYDQDDFWTRGVLKFELGTEVRPGASTMHHPIVKPKKTQNCNLYLTIFEGPFFKPISTF